jgi:hypothetical protein
MNIENMNEIDKTQQIFKYTAIIVEPRKHKALEFVLNNVCDCLSDEWKIILFHGKNNVEYSSEIVNRLNIMFNNRIHTVNLNVDNLNLKTYSELLADRNIIYDHIETDVFLVFQTDSMIFKKNAHLIEDYLDYDYVGAPWLISNYELTKRCNFIGNGGFSLRNKNKMLEIIEKIPYKDVCEHLHFCEDLYFSMSYDNILVNKPSYEKARGFCVDEIFNLTPVACHKFWVHQFWQTPAWKNEEYHFLKKHILSMKL